MSHSWLIPFGGRKYSGAMDQNFLWKSDNIYIMDNHRAALWCWFQHLERDRKVNLIHIDMHTDTLYSQMETWLGICPDMWTIKINDYLDIMYKEPGNIQFPLFSWTNYASIFMEKYPHLLDTCIFITHGKGDPPKSSQFHLSQPDVFILPANFSYWLEDEDSQWICNVDLDYFFYEQEEGLSRELFSADYFNQVFHSVREQLESKKILVLTISLSPECCGGWETAERICDRACKVLGIDFHLPKN